MLRWHFFQLTLPVPSVNGLHTNCALQALICMSHNAPRQLVQQWCSLFNFTVGCTMAWKVWGSNPGRQEIFSSIPIQTSSGAYSASCTIGTVAPSPGTKQLGGGNDYPHSSSTEVKMSRAIPLLPSVPAWHVICRPLPFQSLQFGKWYIWNKNANC